MTFPISQGVDTRAPEQYNSENILRACFDATNSVLNVGISAESIDLDVEGPVAEDSPVSGNPLQTAARSAAFTGAAFANVVSADNDVVRFKASRYGVQWVTLAGEDGGKKGLLEEDAAHASSDLGIQSLSVRNDTLASLCDTDGDYTPLQVNASGALYTVTTGTGAGQYAEDAAHTDGDIGNQVLAVRNDTLASLSDTDGDYSPVQVDALGAVYLQGAFAEDAAHTTGDYGHQVLSVRNDALASLCDTDGDYTPNQVDANGALYVQLGSAADNSPIATDDSAQDATPEILNVGGEYRSGDTTYADGDAFILQGDVNGYVKVRSKSYDAGTTSDKSFEVNPVSDHHVEEKVTLTNVANATPEYVYIDNYNICSNYLYYF